MNILVTGGAGFIGSAFMRLAVQRGYVVTVLDKLTYAGDLARLAACRDRTRFYRGDICNRELVSNILEKEQITAIVHFAAESHVDRSILDASPFIETNVRGTQVLLDLAREFQIEKFVHMSTDEVYGQLGEDGMFTEDTPFNPSSPYSASKAAADMLTRAYHRTYGLPVCIVRACNNYGPWQYPEKLIPVVICKALQDQKVPVYAQGLNVREWLYVDDCCEGIFAVLEKGRPGEAYNIGSGQEQRNIDVVKAILDIMGKSHDLIEFVKDRPGHDFRYRLDESKSLSELGFNAATSFTKGLEQTVRWNLDNRDWLFEKLQYLADLWRNVYIKK
ncbi:MAG: dTDP-glucose 4,6-dehydratase [Dehalococcoidia bacterium]|jgi:dTDP-glucose 4,6-dehydratase